MADNPFFKCDEMTSTTAGPFDTSTASLDTKSYDGDSTTTVLRPDSGHKANHTPISLLSLPREIRDMIYELLASSCGITTIPVLLTSSKPGCKHLIVAGGRAKLCRDTLLPRYDHCYDNLLLVSRQVNTEIAEATRTYLPFSVRTGTRSACQAFIRCFKRDEVMAGHLKNAKTIILSWVDAIRVPRLARNVIYSTDTEESSAYWSECSAWFYRGLAIFFGWYKQRIHEGNPPRLIINVEGFLCASERRYDPQLRNAIMSLYSIITDYGYIPREFKIGYIISAEIVGLLRSHRLRYPVNYGTRESALSELRALLPWGHLGHLNMDEDSIRYSPEVDIRQMEQ